MSRALVFVFPFLFGLSVSQAQITIAKQSFESSGDTWTPLTLSTPACTSGTSVWDYSTLLNGIAPNDGAQFWGIRDLRGPCNGDNFVFESISLPNVDISSYSNVSISFDYYAIGFDNQDDIAYQVYFDNIGQGINLVVDGGNFNSNTGGWLTETINVPVAVTNVRIEIRVRQDDIDDYGALDNIQIEGSNPPEIDLIGNGNAIPDGSTGSSTVNDTNFGVTTAGTPVVKTFTIENNGTGDLDLTGVPLVSISGSADFTVTAVPTTPVTAGGSTTFDITYNPLVASSATAIVTINNNDFNESIYDFVIQGTATPVGGGPEIEVQGNDQPIFDGDTTPSVEDFTDFGITNLTTAISIPFFIYNFGSSDLTLSSTSLSGSSDFSLIPPSSSTIATGGITDFVVTFTPNSIGTFSTTVTISNDDSDEGTYTFVIRAEVQNLVNPVDGPGGVNGNLKLWLKADSVASSFNDGDLVTSWDDQAYGSTRTARAKVSEEPTFRDNASNNINFNPSVYFDGTKSMYAGQGFNNHDMYIVVKPDGLIDQSSSAKDIFCGDDVLINPTAQDVTGFEMGASSARYTNEVVAYNQATESQYGAAEIGTSYSGVQMFNVRKKSSGGGVDLYNNGAILTTTEVNTSSYKDIVNSRYWLGRSELFAASYDGSILEVITYDTRNSDANRDRIESYLAIKYGVTLGINGTSQDYYDSSGSVIWDASMHAGFNYDIAGIGRDDNSLLNQKQSKSENSTSEVSIGLGDIAATNSANANTFSNDGDFLIWGHNGGDLNFTSSTINFTLGPEAITTTTDITDRIWKIVEVAGDVPTVKVSVPTASFVSGLPALSGNDAYVMYIADDAGFTTNQETIFLETNGANQEITYDFNGTKFFTFGVAHEVVAPRRMEFDGNNDHITIGDKLDINSAFSISAWVRTTGSNANSDGKTIVSKNGVSTGYILLVRDNNTIRFGNGNGEIITSSTAITTNVWHHVALVHDGSSASIYIDGVLDISSNIGLPSDNSNIFSIGAHYRSETDIRSDFAGDLDEVRIWDGALTVDQIRFMMNQEIEEFGTGVQGSILPNTLSKNDISSLNWANLRAYYSMNTYIGTNLNDVSGNGNRGSLKTPDNYDIESQTAPLPYVSLAGGNWNTTAAWENAAVGPLSGQYFPNSASIVNGAITIDWNIVSVGHDVSVGRDRNVLGLISTANELSVIGDSELFVSHYLSLDGVIDLEGESQLVQNAGSDLEATSSGYIEKDQQGTADSYTYNYWGSPVGAINNSSNNSDFTIGATLMDGTNTASPQSINFQGAFNAADGGATSPITMSTFWMYKFVNSTAEDINAWNQVGSSGSVSVGEGFIMKGAGTGNVADDQNFVFMGKPNNGTITLPLGDGNEYLVGNPYASAIDADAFIFDNPSTDGAVRFWQHWGGASHNIGEYQGGYAIYNLSGGAPAVSHPDVDQTGSGTKTPGRYIPVAQGFFVTDNTADPSGGTITFENDQRIFVTEASSSSVFIRSTEENDDDDDEFADTRTKFRIGFDSPGELYRQLLLTVDERTTMGVDRAFDAVKTEVQYDDMFWMVDDSPCIIQGIPSVESAVELPLSISLTYGGLAKISIDALENVPDDINVLLQDVLAGTFTDLRETSFEVNLAAGDYTDRFVLVLNRDTLSIDDQILEEDFDIFYLRNTRTLRIVNPKNLHISNIEMFNLLGQKIKPSMVLNAENDYIVSGLSTGNYIVKVTTEKGAITKKIAVE